jgi:hypothetical protein
MARPLPKNNRPSPSLAGLGAPPEIGGAPSAQTATSGGDDDQPNQGTTVVISPEAVNYHDDAQSCATCSYFGQDGNCQVLQMQVQAEGGCNAWSGGSDQSAPSPAGPPATPTPAPAN